MRAFVCLLALSAVVFASSCKKNTTAEDSKPHIMVSIAPQAAAARAIAGDGFQVSTLLGRGADPETFDPSTRHRMEVDNADIYFATGVLPFEETLRNSAADTPFADTSKGVVLLYGTHGHDHSHGQSGHDHGHAEAPDPHYWSSVEGMRQIARNIATELCRLYPGQSAGFFERLTNYEYHLDSIDAAVKEKLADGDKVFAVWHPSLSYLARDYGLEQIALGVEGKEMSAKNLSAAIDRARAKGVKVFFFQKEYDSRQADALNNGIGSRLVVIDPMAENWEEQLTIVCDELSRP